MHGFISRQLDEYRLKPRIYKVFGDGGFTALPSTPEQDRRQGIDWWVVRSEVLLAIQTKADFKALGPRAKTGNCFIEIVGNEQEKRIGWARKESGGKANYLHLFFVGPGLSFFLPLATVHQLCDDWQAEYEDRPAQNYGYNSRGLIVPLKEVLQYAVTVAEEGTPFSLPWVETP